MVVEAWEGRVEAFDWLANSVAASEKPIRADGDEGLLLGVPIKQGDKLVGVLEVHQRPTTRDDAVAGYLRFMEQMAEIVGSSEVF